MPTVASAIEQLSTHYDVVTKNGFRSLFQFPDSFKLSRLLETVNPVMDFRGFSFVMAELGQESPTGRHRFELNVSLPEVRTEMKKVRRNNAEITYPSWSSVGVLELEFLNIATSTANQNLSCFNMFFNAWAAACRGQSANSKAMSSRLVSDTSNITGQSVKFPVATSKINSGVIYGSNAPLKSTIRIRKYKHCEDVEGKLKTEPVCDHVCLGAWPISVKYDDFDNSDDGSPSKLRVSFAVDMFVPEQPSSQF